MGKRPIVAVSYSFPPLSRPRGVQVYRLLNGLAAMGHQITLFRAEPYSALGSIDSSMVDCTIHPGIRIFSVRSHSRHRLLRAAFALFPFLKWLPDEFSSWILPVYAAVKRHLRETGGNPVLCTFSNPWSDHIVGAWVKKRFKLPWVAHFSDPWAENPYPRWGKTIRTLQRKMENSVVKSADRLVFVSEETRELFIRSNGGFLASKSQVIPHIMSPDWENIIPRESSNLKLVIAHTGDLYGLRTPVGLIKALIETKRETPSILDRLQIRLIGTIEPGFERLVKDANLSQAVSLSKSVTIIESMRQMQEADVLLVIEGKTEGESMFLPSKLFEYLGTGKPLFGLTPLRGTSAKLIASLNGIVADPLDVPAIKSRLISLVEEHRAGTLHDLHHYGKEKVVHFTQPVASVRYSGIVENVQVIHKTITECIA